jgi:hypothetical protein
MKNLISIRMAISGLIAVALLTACEKGGRSVSLLSEETNFSNAPTYEAVPQKIDILWVVDNSGSMESSQTALTSNFSRFIQKFQTMNYDFRMAVTTTDAWVGQLYNQPSWLRLRDGADGRHSGVFVMNRATPNLSDVFLTNATQGISGSGDERAFSSFQYVLNYAGNSDFRRPDAFLAVIIVSDEDDFSANTTTYLNNNYNDSRLIPVSYYKNYLDGFAGAGNYNVNAITIMDTACRDYLNASSSGRRIGVRYIQLVDMTGGAKTSLCGDFGDSLQLISDTIISQRPANVDFKLGREPIESSIVVKLNGAVLAQDATNGWTYDTATWVVSLHGSAITAVQNGATVSIVYDPKYASH